MLRSIHFNDQASRQAGEVRHIGADRNLPPKVSAKGRHLPEVTPEFSFCSGRLGAQAPCGCTTEPIERGAFLCHVTPTLSRLYSPRVTLPWRGEGRRASAKLMRDGVGWNGTSANQCSHCIPAHPHPAGLAALVRRPSSPGEGKERNVECESTGALVVRSLGSRAERLTILPSSKALHVPRDPTSAVTPDPPAGARGMLGVTLPWRGGSASISEADAKRGGVIDLFQGIRTFHKGHPTPPVSLRSPGDPPPPGEGGGEFAFLAGDLRRSRSLCEFASSLR